MLIGLMEENMMVTGKMVSNMVRVHTLPQQEKLKEENGAKVKE
jgi:hypothetical protein